MDIEAIMETLGPVLMGISGLTVAQVASCLFTFVKNVKQMKALRKEVRDNTKECEMAQKVLEENAELKKQLTHVMSKMDKYDQMLEEKVRQEALIQAQKEEEKNNPKGIKKWLKKIKIKK